MENLTDFLIWVRDRGGFNTYFGDMHGGEIEDALDDGSVEALLAGDEDLRERLSDALESLEVQGALSREAYDELNRQVASLNDDSNSDQPSHVLTTHSPNTPEPVASEDETSEILLRVLEILGDPHEFAQRFSLPGGQVQILHDFISRVLDTLTISRTELSVVLHILDEDIIPHLQIDRLQTEFKALRWALTALKETGSSLAATPPKDQVRFAELEFEEVSPNEYAAETDILIHSTSYRLFCRRLVRDEGNFHELAFELKTTSGQLLFHGSVLLRSDSWQYVAKTRIDKDLPKKDEGEMNPEESELARHMKGMGIKLARMLFQYLQDHADATNMQVVHIVDGPKKGEMPRDVWLRIFGPLLEGYKHDPKQDTWTYEYQPGGSSLSSNGSTRDGEQEGNPAAIASGGDGIPGVRTRSSRPVGTGDNPKEDTKASDDRYTIIGVGSNEWRQGLVFGNGQNDVEMYDDGTPLARDVDRRESAVTSRGVLQYAPTRKPISVPENWETLTLEAIAQAKKAGLTKAVTFLELASVKEIWKLFTAQKVLYKNLIEAEQGDYAARLAQTETSPSIIQILQLNAAIKKKAFDEVKLLVDKIAPDPTLVQENGMTLMGNTSGTTLHKSVFVKIGR